MGDVASIALVFAGGDPPPTDTESGWGSGCTPGYQSWCHNNPKNFESKPCERLASSPSWVESRSPRPILRDGRLLTMEDTVEFSTSSPVSNSMRKRGTTLRLS